MNYSFFGSTADFVIKKEHLGFLPDMAISKRQRIAIRQSKDIKGFCYKRKEIKLFQYADDTQILLDGSEKYSKFIK